MCKSLVGRVWMMALVLLCCAVAAAGQVAVPQLQNAISWGWVPQTNLSVMPLPLANPSADDSAQTDQQIGTQSSKNTNSQSSSNSEAQTPDGAASQDQGVDDGQSQVSNVAPTDATTTQQGNESSSSNSSSAPPSVPVLTNTNSSSSRLGSLFPLKMQPDGVKIGPLYVTDVSDSFFYAVNTVPGAPTETFAGNSIQANIIYNKEFGQGNLVVDAREQFSVSQANPFFNQSVGATFTDQLTERWSAAITAQFVYFQNSILANPQYLLSYQNAGLTQQTLFAMQRGYTMYESNSIAFSYQISGRTQITLSPILGATFLDQEGGWSSSHQFGGSVAVTRSFTPNLNLGAFYSLSHTVTTGVTDSPAWNSQSLGVSFDYKFRQSWTISGSLAASGQLLAQVWTLTPTGSIRVMKSFGNSSLSAAYTRAEASNVFVSSGFYDQGDIAYMRKLGQKMSFNVGVGEFRTINAGINQNGKRAGGGLTYFWRPRVSINAGYNFAHQNGTQTSSFSPFLGNTNSFNVGINWQLGSRSGR
jgi:hypothetical protein